MSPRHGMRRERVRASAQYADGSFQNPGGVGLRLAGPPLSVMGEFLFRRGRRFPTRPLPVVRPHEAWQRAPESDLRVTWLGHSTVLLEVGGRRVLTDPVFAERASPLSFAGPKRFHPVPAALSELPPLDAVLLSHDHYDHLCRPTMEAVARMGVPIVTALGVGAHLEAFGVAPERITELDWHERAEIGGVGFTAAPSQHFSGRTLGGRNKTLWASWVIEAGRSRVFFSGDTGLTPLFRDVGARYGPFDMVMLEVGAFHPSWASIHLGPENALEALAMLGGGALLPVHWGTFNLALHDWDEPAETLLRLAQARGARVLTPRLGAPLEPSRDEGPDPWWRAVEATELAAPQRVAIERHATEPLPEGAAPSE